VLPFAAFAAFAAIAAFVVTKRHGGAHPTQPRGAFLVSVWLVGFGCLSIVDEAQTTQTTPDNPDDTRYL
jgi:hypothetical protein